MPTVLTPETVTQLLVHLGNARWFSGKDRSATLRSVTPLPWLTAVDSWPAVRFEIATVAYGRGEDALRLAQGPGVGEEFYQLAVSYHSAPDPALHHAEIGRWSVDDLGPVVAYDAMQDPAACLLIMKQIIAGQRFRDHDRSVVCTATLPDRLSADLQPQIFTGQQSNTSVMFGDVAMLKLFRRLELGHNLDIEVHEALSRSGVADVAQLFGHVEASWSASSSPDGTDTDLITTDLAMVVEKLADAHDGWNLALERLATGVDFSDEAHALGVALAEIHGALRDAFVHGTRPGDEVATIMINRLQPAIDTAPALQPYSADLVARFTTLNGREIATQRVHGDFHLGQTLHTPTGWKIIDFEGEPAKSLAERAAPDSVWRDVAGMLRSFDYAAAAHPGPNSQRWANSCRQAFLAGYAAGDLDQETQDLLAAYEADKAIYEVVYEVRNRPEWVNIPLTAVAAIAAQEGN